MSVSSLRQSIDILDRVDRPNGGVLIDGLHLARTGGTPADVAAVAPARLAYAQLCDAPAEAPENAYADALDGRSTLGDGGLPISALVDALLHTPHSRWRSDLRRCGRRSPTRQIALDTCSTRRTRGSPSRTQRQRRIVQRIGSVVSPRRMNGWFTATSPISSTVSKRSTIHRSAT